MVKSDSRTRNAGKTSTKPLKSGALFLQVRRDNPSYGYMKPLLLAVVLLGASFSGVTIKAKAGGGAGGVVNRPLRLVNYQLTGEEIPSWHQK